MALTVERRNEIAWLFYLQNLKNKPIPQKTVKEICDEIANQTKIKNDVYLRDFIVISLHTLFSEVFKDVWVTMIRTQTNLSVHERNAFAWEFIIAQAYANGLKIGDYIRRSISNEGKKINIPRAEAFEFGKLLIAEVYNRTMAELQK